MFQKPGPAIGLGASIVSMAVIFSHAGPLDPPAGPVAPTYRTLAEVEPRIPVGSSTTPGDADSVFRISQPGSYYLTGILQGVAGKSGIEIASHNVTLDLGGFTLTGVGGSLAGITRDSTQRGPITVRNGKVTGWGGSGVSLANVNSADSPGGLLEGIHSHGNVGNGFTVADGATVITCVAGQNGQAGFEAASHAVFRDCVANGNGLSGFYRGFGCTYSGCVSRANTAHGYEPSGTSSFSNCSASTNDGNGFSVTRCTLTGCDASSNDGWGIDVLSGGTVQSCGLGNNLLGGIQCSTNAHILRNSVTAGATEIRASSADNRIEGNTAVDCATGFDIASAGNLIICNSASGGTTRFSIVAGNSAGPIVVAAGMPVLTNPAANFDF